MAWSIHRVSLPTHDLAAARAFFGSRLGLGPDRVIDERTIAFGAGSRGLRVRRPGRAVSRAGKELLAEASGRHVAIEIDDLQRIARALDKAAVPYVEAAAGDFDGAALYALDPALNVVAFCQASGREAAGGGVQPWEKAWGWGVHHVNLPAGNVREAVAFYTEIAGMAEGRWRAPPSRGNFSIDPAELSVLALDDFNRGLHIIRPDAGFAHRNNFAHNPSIGGHPALFVPSVAAVKARLEAAGTLVSDAGVYAMAGMHQLYMLDPTANMIEVNQFV